MSESAGLYAKTATLGSVPAACMIVFTVVGLRVRVSKDVAGALQHFASGVLLCTIATELLPDIVQAKGTAENLSAFVGFFLGVGLLIVLGMVLPDHDDDRGEEEENGIIDEVAPPGSGRHGTSLKQKSKLCAALEAGVADIDAVAGRTSRPSRNSVEFEPPTETAPLVENSARLGYPAKPFPTTLVLAIALDSCIDGLLIGIAASAAGSGTAGPMMAASLAVEMGFLGLTLATAMHGHPCKWTVPSALLGPCAIVGGAVLGGMLSEALSASPVYLVGLLSFGTSALLFMVAEELLLEAHEEGEHIWWVDLQLYVGFFVSIMAGKVAGE